MVAYKILDAHDVSEVVKFYERNMTCYLWPRTADRLQEMADEKQLFLVRDHRNKIVASCYVKHSTDPPAPPEPPLEFGGVVAASSCRNKGLASCLARVSVALAVPMLWEVDWGATPNLIAHVHTDNASPEALLASVGFTKTEIVEGVPDSIAPDRMPRDVDGFVRGRVWTFPSTAYGSLAVWLESFSGQTKAGVPLKILCERWSGPLDPQERRLDVEDDESRRARVIEQLHAYSQNAPSPSSSP